MVPSFKRLWPLLLHILVLQSTIQNIIASDTLSYSHCDENSTPANKARPSILTPNTFHKVCPGTTGASFSDDDDQSGENDTASKKLSQPICGDGTAFSFYYHKPAQRSFNKDKILIEFQGGGACWDDNTCQQQQELLTFPTALDGFLGYSCSEVNYSMDNYEGYEINLLCANTISGMDLSEYNYVFVPYCTQDVHMGDGSSAYSDDDSSSRVIHHGAHNMMGVLNWIYANFPDPSHIFLTGCSAGGTVLPVAYDLINNHYNSFLKGGRTVNINTIIDSAVYLTPSYFLEYGIDNWNPWTVLAKTTFPYDVYKYNINYSTKLWEHILSRGSKKDKWGFVTHTYDPVSIQYWQAMGGEYYGDDDGNNENNNDDDGNSWSNDLSTSLATIQGKHSNVDVFYIEGEGHCSFGLQYALQEDGFEDFAIGIIAEQRLLRKTASSFPSFTLSVALGSIFILVASLSRAKTQRKQISDEYNNADVFNSDNLPAKKSWTVKVGSVIDPILPFVQRYEKCPITSGLFITTSLYFIIMMLTDGFAHPLNNPSLGPPASTLSTFGINNPTLIVTKGQMIRLFTSPFVCSGVITYFMFATCIFKCMRHAEAAVSSNLAFGAVLLIIAIGSNLIYTLFGEGASCGSLALALGTYTFSIAMSTKYGFDTQFPRLWSVTFLNAFFAIVLLPFNSWIIIVAAMTLGAFVAPLVIQMDDYVNAQQQNHSDRVLKTPLIMAIAVIYGIGLILILSGVPKPSSYYQYPYLTGCAMMYTPDLDAVMESFGGERRRTRELGDYEGFCAQFCVPHLIEKPFYWGLGRFTDYEMIKGTCNDIGYDAHVADKTMTYLGYSLDIEAYYQAGDDDGAN